MKYIKILLTIIFLTASVSSQSQVQSDDRP
jgi:hypothetical protein